MSGLLERVSSLFDRRFLLNALLPVLLIGGGAATLTLIALGQADAAASYWRQLDVSEQVLLSLSLLTFVWFVAGVLASQLRRVTQLYEGYPLEHLPLIGQLTQAFTENHFQRRNEWREQASRADDVFYSYPEGGRSDFLPTRLGNTLRAAEYYGRYRYGIPTTFLWPRLFYLAPEHFRRDIEDFRTNYEWLLGVSFMAGLASLTVGGVEVLAGSSWWLFACTFGGGSILAWAAYHAAVASAEEYGAQLRAGVDLYRTEVLLALRWPPPATLEDEKAMWREARLFHLRGAPRSSKYGSWLSPNTATDHPGAPET